MTTFLYNRKIYERVVCGIVPQMRERLWIVIADIKDMYVSIGGREWVRFWRYWRDAEKRRRGAVHPRQVTGAGLAE